MRYNHQGFRIGNALYACKDGIAETKKWLYSFFSSPTVIDHHGE